MYCLVAYDNAGQGRKFYMQNDGRWAMYPPKYDLMLFGTKDDALNYARSSKRKIYGDDYRAERAFF